MNQPVAGGQTSPEQAQKLEAKLSQVRSQEIKQSMPGYPMQWSEYGEVPQGQPAQQNAPSRRQRGPEAKSPAR